jgi:hypothetical protein
VLERRAAQAGKNKSGRACRRWRGGKGRTGRHRSELRQGAPMPSYARTGKAQRPTLGSRHRCQYRGLMAARSGVTSWLAAAYLAWVRSGAGGAGLLVHDGAGWEARCGLAHEHRTTPSPFRSAATRRRFCRMRWGRRPGGAK